MQRRRTIYLVISLVLFVLLYLWLQWQFGKIPQKTATSVYGKSSLGVQLFYELAEQLRPGSVVVYRKSLWQENQIPDNAILFLLSPKKGLSPKSVELLTAFVGRGGHLVLSFENESSWLFIMPLLDKLGGPKSFIKDDQFKNGVVSLKSPSQDLNGLQAGEKYAFYSQYLIADPECKDKNFACYARQWSYQKGQVLLMAGLPLFSNALLERNDNRQFAFRLIADQAPLWFDEYHHFYSDHTFVNLLFQPSFGLPFLGMMVCVWLFFILGHNREAQIASQIAASAPKTNFHQLNENILANRMESLQHFENALQLHQSFLEKNFPYAKKEIAAVDIKIAFGNRDQFLRCAQNLIRLHQDLVARKRGLSR